MHAGLLISKPTFLHYLRRGRAQGREDDLRWRELLLGFQRCGKHVRNRTFVFDVYFST